MSNRLGGDTFTRNVTDGRMDALTVGYFLGPNSVRKSIQESVSSQQIQGNYYEINLISSK